MFTNEISEFVIDLHWWFKQSAARREDFEAVQQELGLAQHTFLKHVESRWLSLLPAVVRALEQFQALEKYFLLDLPRKQRSMTNMQGAFASKASSCLRIRLQGCTFFSLLEVFSSPF